MRISSIALLALVSIAFVPASQAGFINDTVNVGYYYPDSSTLYNKATYGINPFVVGAGVETSIDVEGVTQIGVDFSDHALTLNFTTTDSNPTWNSTSFNGLIFDLQSPGSFGITGVAVDPSSTYGGSFDVNQVSFNDTQIAINWGGVSYQDGQKLVLNFTFSPVPEPSGVVLVGIGLVGLVGVTVRRRVTKTA